MYTYINAELSEYHNLAVASQRVEHGVICLLSALQYHGIGTQAPFEVWVAIDVHAAVLIQMYYHCVRSTCRD
jgi:predicted transcriptional regulator of viral defense system